MPPSSAAEHDLAHCAAMLRAGSKSFAFASLLLPRGTRRAATAFYAFCREADDAVDEAPGDPRRALDALAARLDGVFGDAPGDSPVDRALARVVQGHGLSRRPFDALLEGFLWDVEGRRYRTLADVRAYATRVAASVGVVMTELMGRRAPSTLARACDLGVAMQLTNIARDVGADARIGRVYLPLAWFEEAGLDADAFLRAPAPRPEIAGMVRRLVVEADGLYARAVSGIRDLPFGCRASIHAAALIYADIHRSLARAGWDSVSARARVSGPRKLALLGQALGRTVLSPSAAIAPPLPEAAYLTSGA